MKYVKSAKVFVYFSTNQLSFLLNPKIFSKITASSFGVGDEFINSAREENFSLLYQITSVYDGKNLAGIMVCDENTDVFLFKNANHVFDISDSQRIDVGKGFV